MHSAQVGDKGQRYEIRVHDIATNTEIVVGWTERSDGGTLFVVSQLRPLVKNPIIVDRESKHEWRSGMGIRAAFCRVCGITRPTDINVTHCQGRPKPRR